MSDLTIEHDPDSVALRQPLAHGLGGRCNGPLRMWQDKKTGYTPCACSNSP